MTRSFWHFWFGCPADQLRKGRRANGWFIVWCDGCRRLAKGKPK